MPMSVIQPILNRLLNVNPKTNPERVFIHRRLCLHDRRYCFDLHRYLWQSYLDIGAPSGTWPVSILVEHHFS
jgi:hypothetical protein